jgi:hypothetical protein
MFDSFEHQKASEVDPTRFGRVVSPARPVLRVLLMILAPGFPRRFDLRRTRAATGSLFGLLLLAFEAPPAHAGSVGLSSVRGAAIENYPVAGDLPEGGEHFAAALAVGDFNGDLLDDLATGIPFDDGVADIEQDIGAVIVQFGALGRGLAPPVTTLLLSQESGPDLSFDNEHFGAALAVGDFNHDFIDDLAVGVPGNVVGGNAIGGVQVYYGSTLAGVFDGGVLLAIGGAANDSIGAALATGDFDDDSFDDLAVGIPGQANAAGAVFVIYGSAAGLTSGGQLLQQNNPDIEDTGEANDKFGFALAAGDFNANGKSDLVVGVPNENGSGAIQIFFGASSGLGLDLVNDILWTQNSIAGTSEPNDKFGFALATGDFDDDGRSDLAIGSPGEALGLANELTDSGSVAVLYGVPGGVFLRPHPHPGMGPGGRDRPRDGGDGRSLRGVVGGRRLRRRRSPRPRGRPSAGGSLGANDGAVTVLLGGATGFQAGRSRVLAAGVEGLPGVVQASSNYGQVAATGDFDWDGKADLVIGAPFYNASPFLFDSGMQVVLYGCTFCDGFDDGASTYWSSVAP